MFLTNVAEKIETHILYSVTFFLKANRLFDYVAKYCTAGQATDDIWRMRIACWIPKFANTLSAYVIPIAFPLQQWLPEWASSLSYTHIACLVSTLAYLGTVNSSLEMDSLQWHDAPHWFMKDSECIWFMKDSECIRHLVEAERIMKWKLETANLKLTYNTDYFSKNR